MTILIRDGIAHFAVVVALNVANIVALLLTKGVFSFTGASELISTVVIQRFFLNLRQLSTSSDSIGNTCSSYGSSFPRFASRIIGNMGEMLESSPLAFEDDLDHQETDLDDTINSESSNHLYFGEEPSPGADERGLVPLAEEASSEHGACDNVVDEEEITVISNNILDREQSKP